MHDQTSAVSANASDGPSAMPEVVRHRPVFSGQTGEYFGIWFVNLLLSIVTLGIYSAWAKVRTERYFYGSTTLAGSSFEYLADPIAILKGRLIAYAAVIALGVSSRFSPGLYAVLLLALFALMPMIIVLSLRFRARNSAWRGLTFRFDRGIGAAYGPFMGWAILSGITASLLYPLMKLRQHDFVVGGHGFGRKRFSFAGDSSKYYNPYLIAAGAGIVTMVVFFASLTALTLGAKGGTPGPRLMTGIVVAVLVFYVGLFAIGIFLRVRYNNLLWNNSQMEGHRFESSQRVRDMLWIYASNLVAILCTVGLAVPWAMTRLARYRAAHFQIAVAGSIEDFAADAQAQHGAAGAELVDALDFGLDIGF